MTFRQIRHGDVPRRSVSSMLVAVVVTLVSVIGVGVAGSTASATECDALSVPSVDVDRCVVPGRQTEIDAGNVARVPDLSTANGHWLAGHRSTHGSTFGPLTGLEMGDLVTYRDQQYQVVEYTTALFANPGHVLGWTSMDVPTVVLQTSVDSVSAHLWRAEMIPVEDATVSVEEVVAAVAVRDELVHTAVAAVFAQRRSGPSRIAAMTSAAL